MPASALLPLTVLQSGQPAGAVGVGLFAYELVGAALGLFIAFLAWRGYRRNQSRAMLFVSLGFVLVLGVPLAVTLAYLALPVSGYRVAVQALTQTFEIAGLLCIIHGLRS